MVNFFYLGTVTPPDSPALLRFEVGKRASPRRAAISFAVVLNRYFIRKKGAGLSPLALG